MNALSFLWNYVRWHYTVALVDLYFIARNYLWGIGHVFSVDVLLRTLFVPWHRLGAHGASLIHEPFEFLGDVLVNIVMRLLGFVVRLALLLLSLLSALVILTLFILLFGFWLLLPVILFSLLVHALDQLFL